MSNTEASPKAAPVLGDADLDTLAGIVHERSSICLDPNQREGLQARLAGRLRELELDTFEQYAKFLSMGPYQHDEFQELLALIDPAEPPLFDHQAQLDVFARTVLPELIEARKDSKHLRIWSAACGNGAEPYTLAMIIHDTLGVRAGDWHIEILGTDLSEKRLATANTGVYDNDALRATPDHLKRRYFKQAGKGWALSDEILQLVGFEPHNLTDRFGAKQYGTWDAIFCRDTLSLFDEDTRQRVLGTFHDQLADDGTLFVGTNEIVQPGQPSFIARAERDGSGYRKG